MGYTPLHSLDLVWSVTPPATRGRLRRVPHMARHVLERSRVARPRVGGAYNNHYAWHKRLLAEVGLRPSEGSVCDPEPMELLTSWRTACAMGAVAELVELPTPILASRAIDAKREPSVRPLHPPVSRGACLKDLFTAPLKIARSDATYSPWATAMAQRWTWHQCLS